MIEVDEPIFPNNVVLLLKAACPTAIDPDVQIFTRPLRSTDPQQSIGIFGQQWTPDDNSIEMVGGGVNEPLLQQYLISLQAFVRHGDEEVGLAIHSVLSSRLRRVLYRHEVFRLALQGLSATDSGVTESMRRWGVRTQRYLSNEINENWVYLSTLEFWIETETR